MYPYNIDRSNYTDYQNNLTARSQNISSQKNSTVPADKKLLSMIEEAVCDERRDSYYYKELMNIVRNPKDREVIRSIYMDEIKHEKLLIEIYKMLTGRNIPDMDCEMIPPTLNIVNNYEKSIFGELEGMEFYRQLYFLFQNQEIRDMLFEIITDEQKHATKFNYLFSKK